MKHLVKVSALLALVMGAVTLRVQADTLKIGDPAPKIEVKSFVKGEPVSEFEPGKNYVVEFWATWCGPCKTSIPHLTELQKKNPSVTFIGVSVWEQDQDKVKPFVDEMGDKMGYRVAVDLVLDKEKANEGSMAKYWMTASGQNGIPSAFIINKEGKVAWIGHPMEMDKPLEKIIAGTWDLKEAEEEKKKAAEVRSKMMKVQSKVAAAMKSGDPKNLVDVIDEVIADVPAAASMLGPIKLTALIKLDQQDKALEFAKTLLQSDIGKAPDGLNILAWTILDPDSGCKPNAKLLEFAVETAKSADEKAEGKDGVIADTLALAYFKSGDVKKAVETQERAVRLVKASGKDVNQDILDRLEEYKKAAK